MKVLVTGASGFVGNHLVEMLVERGDEVRALVQPGQDTDHLKTLSGVEVIYGDLTHMTIFTPQTLGQLLRPAGFADLRFYETGPVPIGLRGKVDVALWATIKALANAIRHLETGKQQTIWTENFLALAFKR